MGTDGDYSDTDTPFTEYYKGSLTSIDQYYWNYNASNRGTNTWSTSLLNKINLNTNFITNIGTEWAKKITTTTWKVGGNTYENLSEVVPSVAYQNEIVNPVTTNTTDNATEYTAKIGLMYVSDYGYAASPAYWTYYGYNDDATKDYRAATSSNWMYMGLRDFTISRGANQVSLIMSVDIDGSLFGNDVSLRSSVRPSFSLETTVNYVSGSGTQSDPIIIE